MDTDARITALQEELQSARDTGRMMAGPWGRAWTRRRIAAVETDLRKARAAELEARQGCLDLFRERW
jgi:hypothetical protein